MMILSAAAIIEYATAQKYCTHHVKPHNECSQGRVDRTRDAALRASLLEMIATEKQIQMEKKNR
jgi:hypothetical protein